MNTGVMWNEQAEVAVLSAFLVAPQRATALTTLAADEFYDPRNREVAGSIASLLAQSRAVDAVTVADELGDRLAAVGGFVFLSELMEAYFTADNVAHYTAIIADCALRRRVVKAASEVIETCNQDVNSGEDCHSEFLRKAGTVEGPAKASEAISLAQVVHGTLKRMSDMASGKVVARGVMTGFRELDAMTGGIAKGAVTILAGRPSQGKSSLARSIAFNAARAGHATHVFSLEDTRDRYGDRTLADISRVDLSKFSDPNPQFARSDLEQIRRAVDETKCVPLVVDDAAGLGSAQIQNRVLQQKRSQKTELVVVDYVQLMHERGARDKREEVDRAVEGLVRLARTEKIAVLALSQLSRDSEKRDDKRPMLSDLRESGTLEQVADAVFMVHQDWRYLDPESKKAEIRDAYKRALNVGEVLIRKNKHGRQGEVRLRWDAPVATYRDMPIREEY